MLPPMRPSPMTPICICFTPYKMKAPLLKRCINCPSQLGQPCIDIRQVDAERAPAAFHQHLEIAARLRRLHHAEAVGMAGHLDIGRIIASEVEEHPGIRAALVSLPG